MKNSQKKVESLEAMLRIARAMSIEKDLDSLLNLILESTTQVLHAERSTLFLYEPATDELYTKIAQKEKEAIRFKANLGIAGAAAQGKKIINIKNAYDDIRFNKEIDRQTGYKTRNIIASPLITHEDKLIGVLEALNKIDEDIFSKDDEAIFEAFSSHVAIAIDNNMLIQQYLEKKKMEHALELARQIQQNLLPRKVPDFAGLEIGSIFVPCDQTGGDYFDFFLAGGKLCAVIGDVAGHGIGPALIMSETRALIHAVSHTSEIIKADTILRIANKLLAGDMMEGRFVTLFLGIFDKNRDFYFSSAGHGNVYHYVFKQKSINEFEPTGLPLGIFEEGDFEEKGPVTIKRGDVILFATDGVEESINKESKEYTKERLFDCLIKNSRCSANDIIQNIYSDLLRFVAGQPQKDDITMFAVKAL